MAAADEIAAQRAALAAAVGARIPAILERWKDVIAADPALTTHRALSRSHLLDHLPRWLEAFAAALAKAPSALMAPPAGDDTNDATAHGHERWKQGYDLGEVTREWGALHRCLVDELEQHAKAGGEAMAGARATLALFVSEATSDSTEQYFRLARIEAAGSVSDLEDALATVREVEQRQAELWQQAAHDLRGNLGVVANVASAFDTAAAAGEANRANLFAILRRNVDALHRLLDDVTELTRLSAGEERRAVPVDIAETLHDLCESLRPLADAKKLTLTVDGAASLPVEGDAIKIRRVAQNLILNAFKYTKRGGVEVGWREDPQGHGQRWVLSVVDTGPGFNAGPGTPLLAALAAVPGEAPAPAESPPLFSRGEGIGLAIVKRLCELLHARIHVESGSSGTTFRVTFPSSYPSVPDVPAVSNAPG